jgi:hypothetical protein
MPSLTQVALGIFAIVAGSFTTGMITGKVLSPKYEELGQVQDKVELQMRISKSLVGRNPKEQGGLISFHWDTLVTATFSAGRYDYIWLDPALPLADTLKCRALDPHLRKCAAPGHEPIVFVSGMTDVAVAGIAAAMGLPTTLNLKNIEPVLETRSGWVYVASVFGGAVGFITGYKLAYRDAYDPDSEKFKAVLTDPACWRDIVANKLARSAAFPVHGVVVP